MLMFRLRAVDDLLAPAGPLALHIRYADMSLR
jgi:hypothetical protein